ncbi:MAG TPA: uracil-DNA glycosylase family protein, partial [Paracoccaceae bacterium]|nr:uracil-DNA glycosylase family protein [Paracoccaceae bacterium]
MSAAAEPLIAAGPEAPRDCGRCARLVAYRAAVAGREPLWFNGAVPSFGDPEARLLVVGLAPGVAGANRTGRPFTGDYAGELLYTTLSRHDLAHGTYRADPADGFQLTGAMVTNAVRCVPPLNRPT